MVGPGGTREAGGEGEIMKDSQVSDRMTQGCKAVPVPVTGDCDRPRGRRFEEKGFVLTRHIEVSVLVDVLVVFS